MKKTVPEVPRREYTPPYLVEYGDIREITRTLDNPKNKNDPVQGGANLKT
jgi:hypothetical protein